MRNPTLCSSITALALGAVWIVAAAAPSSAGSAPATDPLHAGQDADPDASSTSDDDEEKAAEKAAEKERSRRAKARALRIAEQKLTLATLEKEDSSATAKQAFDAATHKLALAQMSLEETVQMAGIEAREAQLKVDEARYAAEHAQDELSELIAMYEADEFAEMTKELILKRGRRNLEVAGRELEIQSERLEVGRLTRERKHAAAKGAVAEARQGVEAAKRGLRKSELEGSISLLEAQSTIDGLRDELEALTR